MFYTLKSFLIPSLAIAIVVLASNILVHYPFNYFGLTEYLTWGAFTYPFAFLINDLTNKRYGIFAAKKVVFIGFIVALILSVIFSNPRTAFASITAFCVAQFLDIKIFDIFRQHTWWRAPLISSFIGSLLDSIIFFTLAFMWTNDPYMSGIVSLNIGIANIFLAQWMKIAIFDWMIKILISLFALIPYGIVLRFIFSRRLLLTNKAS